MQKFIKLMIECSDSNEQAQSTQSEEEDVIITSCCVICNMQADCLLWLRDKALIGRSDRLLTWCLYGCGRAEPVRKRLVFNSRCKANQSTTETLDLTSTHFEVHTQVKIQIMKHNWQVLKKWIENCFLLTVELFNSGDGL